MVDCCCCRKMIEIMTEFWRGCARSPFVLVLRVYAIIRAERVHDREAKREMKTWNQREMKTWNDREWKREMTVYTVRLHRVERNGVRIQSIFLLHTAPHSGAVC